MRARLAALIFFLATVACASQPDPRNPDRIVTGTQAPTLCQNKQAFPSLSPDGNTLAWIGDHNFWFYDLTTGATTFTTVSDLYGMPAVSFSQDGRYAAYPTYNDSNGLIYVVDRNTARRIDIFVSTNYLNGQVAWDARNTFAIVLRDFTIQVYDPAEPNAPILQVAPPDAFLTCRNPAFDGSVNIDATTGRAAAACFDDAYHEKLVTWAYASGTASNTATVALSYDVRSPLLPYPIFDYLVALRWSPTDMHELLISGSTFFTVDTSKDFQPTRMLSDDPPDVFTYTADGNQVVGVVGFGFESHVRAWRLTDGGNPYFISRGNDYGTFTLSSNNILGACNSNGVFHMWYLSRLHA